MYLLVISSKINFSNTIHACIEDYYKKWQERKEDFRINGYYDHLITTDDLGGIKKQIVEKLVKDILDDSIKTSKLKHFSKHHYKLYAS